MTLGTLLIRADAGTVIGSGHVMRCLALAQAWQDAGGDVVLAACELPDGLVLRLAAERVPIHRLRGAIGSEQDAAELAAVAVACKARWVTVDGERFDSQYLERLRTGGCRVLWVDDFGSADVRSADAILNQNLGATRDLYPWARDPVRLLLGVEHVMLRREFRAAKPVARDPHARRSLLVTFGGSDPDGLTERVLAALATGIPDVEVTTIVGEGNPRAASLRTADPVARAAVLVNPPNVPEIMMRSDFAVIAAGGTLWELLYCGCAVLSYARNPVQASVIERLAGDGVVENLGPVAGFDEAALRTAIASLVQSGERLARMRAAGRRIVDGDGVSRVLRALDGECE